MIWGRSHVIVFDSVNWRPVTPYEKKHETKRERERTNGSQNSSPRLRAISTNHASELKHSDVLPRIYETSTRKFRRRSFLLRKARAPRRCVAKTSPLAPFASRSSMNSLVLCEMSSPPGKRVPPGECRGRKRSDRSAIGNSNKSLVSLSAARPRRFYTRAPLTTGTAPYAGEHAAKSAAGTLSRRGRSCYRYFSGRCRG